MPSLGSDRAESEISPEHKQILSTLRLHASLHANPLFEQNSLNVDASIQPR